jgi:PIN domain nuclease of toxin-antitoxin system
VIVLDAHVWIWWVDDHSRLKRSVRDQIDAENDVRVSAISLLEIATAVAHGRLALRPSAARWLEVAQSAQQIRVEPLTDTLCLESATLPESLHRDPADRLIIALARKLKAELITADAKLLSYASVRTIAAE